MLRSIGDFPLEKLKTYLPTLTAPADFDSFWKEMNSFIPETIDSEITWLDYPVASIKVADVSIKSWDETPIRAWLIVPNQGPGPFPALLHFHGYTGSRGQVGEFLKWALQGIAVISFEVRGQGFSPDYARYPNGNQIPGWMTLGIEKKENYYYANVYRDVLTCVDWAFQLEEIDSERVGGYGESQGGALTLIAAAMRSELCLAMADYPFLSHFSRAVQVAGSGPYLELLSYVKFRDPRMENYDQLMKNLAYFDVMNFCPNIKIPTLMSIGLEDIVTPPSTVFAAYNHLANKEIELKIYPENGHEPNPFHEEERIKFVAEYLLARG
ncbi:acetylxylan esterase [Neobacillus dielmonensis]|uniref:acetylxylan esterase n=1 Tax=Neobacillus dielmonensis TaxID=1347369 RepID=UPI0006933F89|nr:alpha/beta fold hydrolase [Neobacillus dielmonensis]